MPLNFSVSNFRGSFAGIGLTDSSLFEFKFLTMPKCLQKNYQATLMDDLSVHTMKSQLPELAIQSNSVSYNGPQIKHASENSTNDMTIEVVSSGNLWERKLFAAWQNGVINYGIPSQDGSTFLVGYYADYTVDAEIYIYNEARQLTSTIRLSKCWPTNVGAIDLDWASHTTPVYFNVTLSYAQWNFVEGLATPTVLKATSGVGGNIGTRIQVQ